MRRRTRATVAAGAVPGALAALLLLAPAATATETPTPGQTAARAPATAATTSAPASTTPPSSTTTSTTTPPRTTSSSTKPPSTKPVTSSTKPPKASASTSRTATSSSTSPSASPTTAPSGSSGGDEQSLSPAQLAAQIAQAGELRAHLAASNTALAVVLTKLDALAGQSNGLLDKLAQARTVETSARTAAKDSEELSTRLDAELATEKQRLRAWAFYAYTEGGSAAELVGVIDAMGDDPAHASNPMGDLSYLTDARAQSFANIQTLQLQQADATYRAEVARTSAEKAAADVAAAKTAVDGVVVEQKALLETLRKAQAADIAKAGPLVGILAGARTPEAVTAYDALLTEMTRNGQSVAGVGALCSKNDGAYPNGMLPAAALCPLWKAPGESLRPRAAAAFNSLSALYAKQTGHPLCVTDSYRSLSEQYAVKASRGMWAATPGTSPHGLGIALDLCGGINSFGTPAYEWMQQNGPLYGWYHPAWAEPGGSLPEPWHWQFAG